MKIALFKNPALFVEFLKQLKTNFELKKIIFEK